MDGRRTSRHPASDVRLYKEEEASAWEPKYIGPVRLVDEQEAIGGGRGFVATQDLEPGTLLLAERPVVLWRDLGIGGSAMSAHLSE